MEKFCRNCKFCKPALLPPRYEFAVCLHSPPIDKVTGKPKPLFCETERRMRREIGNHETALWCMRMAMMMAKSKDLPTTPTSRSTH